MRLTRFTDLSLRVLMYAGLKHPELSSIREIAEKFGIAEGHLTKVVHQLSLAGYLHTVRGRGGGLRLARPLEDINLGEVVRATEPDFRLVECFQPSTGACCLEPACTLAPVFERAMGDFMAVLDEYSFADLLRSRRALAALLAI